MRSILLIGLLVSTASSPESKLAPGVQANAPENSTQAVKRDLAAQPSTAAPSKKPYADLFGAEIAAPKLKTKHTIGAVGRSASTPKVVCGTTIWQADRDVDPKMRQQGPARDSDHKIRRLIPPTCHE